MHLITPYAPGSFLKPILIVSTMFNSETKETAVRFVKGLHVWHALDVSNCHDAKCEDVMGSDIIRATRYSLWRVVQKHSSPGAALEFHLEFTKDFINGGSNEEWELGWEPYLKIYDEFFVDNEEKNEAHVN